MAGAIYEFFGYRADDTSKQAGDAATDRKCPFLNDRCKKQLNNREISGVCAIKPKTSAPVIICPIRLYSDNYRILSSVAREAFDRDLPLQPGKEARAWAITNRRPAVAVFGQRWGGELRLPKKQGHGNYFVDWILALITSDGSLQEFVAIEVQTMDTRGNYHSGRNSLLNGTREFVDIDASPNWENVSKRIIPQLVYKGQVLQREDLCKKGIFFVCPKPVLERIISRLGGRDELPHYPKQNGAITFVAYDYDTGVSPEDGVPLPLTVVDQHQTAVSKMQDAFNRVTLKEANVYQAAIEEALG
jgi:hypothetical protein